MRKYSGVIRRRFWRKSRGVILLALGVFALFQVTVAATRANQTHHIGRFGFGVTREGGPPSNYDVPMLNAGWYWDWAARGETAIPLHEYVQTVRLKPVKSGGVQIGYTPVITGSALRQAIAAQPGGIWFIGNEPDCVNMDNMRSDWYARAYHDMYYFIKAADPTAIVGAGGIVQPTKQRFMYLDRVLDTYEREYGEPLPTDLWVTHGYILCENCYPINIPSEPFAWGACWVPDWPSSSSSKDIATFYSVYDHWDIELFKQRLIDMRQWMHDNGYQYHPLYITEYGILFYDGLVSGMGQEETIEFMHLGFDWMREARDPVLGYAPDDNRIVQRWAWFSLDHDDYFMGNPLFNQNNYNPTAIGTAYGEYTAELSPYTDIKLLDFDMQILTDVGSAPFTATVAVTMSNAGNIAATKGITWTLYNKQAPDVPITRTAFSPLSCCGDYEVKTALWTDLTRSSYVVCPGEVTTMPGGEIECQSFGVDLQVQNALKTVIKVATGTLATVTLTADVSNLGTIGTGEPVTVLFYIPGSNIIPIQSFTIDPLDEDEVQQPLAATWTNLSAGLNSYCVTAMTTHAVSEPACGFVWVNPPHQVYFPWIHVSP